MKIYFKAAGIFLLAAMIVSCSEQTRISGTVDGLSEEKLVLKLLNINSYSVLDTVTTDSQGKFSYKLKLKEGEPEFVYLFRGDTRLAGLLVESGEKVQLSADTLGNYSVSGSPGSEKLAETDRAFTQFLNDLLASTESRELSKIYVAHYRACMAYVLSNPHSLTVIPVLFERVNEDFPVFSQSTDAILFRNIADSLKTVYPKSRYVAALEKEAKSRMNALEIENKIRNAEQRAYPDISAPDTNGELISLSAVESKLILLHFWNAGDAAQKMLNIETLLPVYEEFHERGLEIFAVCLSTDKAEWGSVVKAQKLPWINVNDGLGRNSTAAGSYNINSTPTSMLIYNEELSRIKFSDAAELRRELDKFLRP